MAWSFASSAFDATGCDPERAAAGKTATVTVTGTNQGASFPATDQWWGRLVARGEGDDTELVGEPGSFSEQNRVWSLEVAFDLPDDAAGLYQLLVGWGEDDVDDKADAGEYTTVPTDRDDGLFEVT